MLNLVPAEWSTAVAVAAVWYGAVGLWGLKFRRAACGALRRRVRSISAGWQLTAMGQQLLDAAVQLRGLAREDILEVPDLAGVRPPMPNSAPDRVNTSHQGGSHDRVHHG